jgi:hypothetical protein
MGGCQSRNAVALNNLQTSPFDNDSEAGHGTNDFSLFLDSAAINRRRRRRRRRGEDDEAARLAEIVALQQSLAAMEDFFQSLMGQAGFMMEALDPQNNAGSCGPPPVSKHVLEDLPDISKTLTGDVCGVCGEGYPTTRLPCGHAFHRTTCVEPWLVRHCTCPVCRYELPTDDESYEPGRVERMSKRKVSEDFGKKVVEEVSYCFGEDDIVVVEQS